MMRYECPCCKKYTLHEKPPGTFEICSTCGWEDDYFQYNNPTYVGGANEMSLEEARKRYVNATKIQSEE